MNEVNEGEYVCHTRNAFDLTSLRYHSELHSVSRDIWTRPRDLDQDHEYSG